MREAQKAGTKNATGWKWEVKEKEEEEALCTEIDEEPLLHEEDEEVVVDPIHTPSSASRLLASIYI